MSASVERAEADYGGRIAAARERMGELGIDVLLLSVGADLPYLTGYEAMASERLTMAVIPREGRPQLFVPELEAPRVGTGAAVCDVVAWGEREDPVRMVGRQLQGAGTVAIGDHTWSRFLLELQDRAPGARFAAASTVVAPLRVVKDEIEIGLLAAAGAAADRVAARLAAERFSGRSERQLAGIVAGALVDEGHDTTAFTIVASGPNGASPHHEPTARVIEPGDVVVVDFGGRLGGYHSDTTRTFSVGAPSPDVADAYRALAASQEAGVAAAGPGVPAEAVDAASRDVLAAAGYAEWFVHRTGHGIGLEVHEEPYLVAGNPEPLRPGMAFSVEPGVYLPGRFGMRIEDIVTVTPTGVRRLNRSPRTLVEVG